MATYSVFIGGSPAVKPKTGGFVTVDDDGVRWAPKGARRAPIDASWPQVESIEIAGSDTVQDTRAGAILAFGALGLLSGDKKQCYMVVALADGTTPTFEVHGMTPFEATTRLKDNAHASARLRRPSTPAASIDGLARLVELHDRGMLTDEEFAAAKRQMLGLDVR